jgi:glutathione synthase/RimK-type ligase-like ATP-grasp enzyme
MNVFVVNGSSSVDWLFGALKSKIKRKGLCCKALRSGYNTYCINKGNEYRKSRNKLHFTHKLKREKTQGVAQIN